MIELCTKRRLISALIFMAVLTGGVFILESKLSSHENDPTSMSTGDPVNESRCWEKENFKITESCRKCKPWEKRHQYCEASGYREQVQCTSAVKAFKSCGNSPAVAERAFWAFEGSWLGVGALATLVVFTRQKTLDRKLMEKVHRQIAAGV